MSALLWCKYGIRITIMQKRKWKPLEIDLKSNRSNCWRGPAVIQSIRDRPGQEMQESLSQKARLLGWMSLAGVQTGIQDDLQLLSQSELKPRLQTKASDSSQFFIVHLFIEIPVS